MPLRISVLTVCRNTAKTIRHTLDSFFEQDYPDGEIVVVDALSEDETLDIVRSYPQDRMIVLSEADSGMYDGLNKALALCTGDAVGVLNSDDAYHDRSVLGRIAETLAAADIVHGHLNFVNDHVDKHVLRSWRASQPPTRRFRSGWMPAHPTFYVRRAVAEAVGPFDLTLTVASDYDWMLRAIELHDFRTALIDHVLIDMMQGGKSTSGWRSHIGHNLEALRSRQQWLGSGRLDYALIAKPARKVGQFISRASARAGA